MSSSFARVGTLAMDWLPPEDTVFPDQSPSSIKDVRLRLRQVYGSLIEGLEEKEDLDCCLKELLLDGFDVEQLWSQLEPLNRVLSGFQKRKMNSLETEFHFLKQETQLEIEQMLNTSQMSPEASKEDEISDPQLPDTEIDENSFLNFDEMKEFVEDAEAEEMDDDDLLGSQLDEEEEEVYGSLDSTPGHEIMYKDFFKQVTHSNPEEGEFPKLSLSRIEKEQKKLKDEIEVLEEEAIGEKEWPFRGEIKATDRPLNSALEVDLDFETTVKPPPKPTQTHLDSIENLIKQRIKDRNFDDVERVVPPPIEEAKKVLQLDDSQAKKGLGEVYEEEYVRQTWGEGTIEEKEERLRNEARKLFKEASLQLDALTHFHFAPRPVVEDVKKRTNTPAVVMEEPLPVSVNSASLKTPTEVYQAASKTGEVTESNELTKEDRKRMRAKRKRASKKTGSEMGPTRVVGRQSLVSRQQEAGEKRRKLLKKDRTYTGAEVFRKLQASVETRPKDNNRKTKKQDSTVVKL